MPNGTGRAATAASSVSGDDARQLTDAVTQLRRALRRGIRRAYPTELVPIGRVELLQQIRERPGMPVAALAAALRLAPNTVSTLLRSLFAEGLVDRTTDPADRRVGRLRLTAAGRRQLGQWEEAHEKMLAGAMAGLSARQQRALREAGPALAALAERLREEP